MFRRGRVALLLGIVVLLGSLAVATPRATTPAEASTPTVNRAKVGVALYGDALSWSDAKLDRELDLVRSLGARWVRVPFNWATLQQGGRGTYNWAPSDRIVAQARAHKLYVLAEVSYTPAWARPAGTPPTNPPTNPADYGAFLYKASRRYAPLGVHRWEIWNEPNLASMWTPHPNPSQYTALLRSAYWNLHAADPKAVVITGGLSPAYDAGNHSQISPYTFLARIYVYGGRGAFDQVGLHPYSFPYPSTLQEAWNTFQQSSSLYDLMRWYGEGRKRITATEIGFPTGTSDRAITETEQGTYLVNAASAWLARSYAGPIFVYSVHDWGADISDYFDNFGLVHYDDTLKAGYVTLRHALLGG
jgi:polysaccharide biosynthesis protein PslG